MSVHLEKLVTDWRDAEKAFEEFTSTEINTERLPDLDKVGKRLQAARAALLKYAEEEMG